MKIKIKKALAPVNINEQSKECECTGHFCQPLSRNLTFGLDKQALQEVYGSAFHIGQLILVNGKEKIYDFSIDEVLRTEKKQKVGSIYPLDEKTPLGQRRIKEALLNDYGLTEDDYEIV